MCFLIQTNNNDVTKPLTGDLYSYEKAQKKVRSQKAVYKRGMGSKPYSGEESGISKVVKSVRLG